MDTVCHQVTFTMTGCECHVPADIPIKVTLFWAAESPHEMQLVFLRTRQGVQVWCTAMDLLIDGLYGPAGLGDLSIFPRLEGPQCVENPQCVELILSSPSHPHPVGFTVRRRDLWGFVAAVQAVSTVTTGKGA